MGSFQHPRACAFHPLDLEIMDRVYDAAWAQIEACDPFRDKEYDNDRHKALCRHIIEHAGTGRVEFDTLYERVLGDMPERWATFTAADNEACSPGDAD